MEDWITSTLEPAGAADCWAPTALGACADNGMGFAMAAGVALPACWAAAGMAPGPALANATNAMMRLRTFIRSWIVTH